MVSNAVENLVNQNIDVKEYEREKKDIKIGVEFHSSSYTRNEWDGCMTLDAYKINISKDYCGEKEANYINNALKNINNYSKISLGEVNDFYEFKVVYLDCWDNFRTIDRLEESLFNLKEEIKSILKIFDITSFELIGLLYYSPAF
ncbi:MULTISPECIES: hypothetical protein [unclassified Clostridium]|uniref:hypothetical protein n=1 Tax=unclassified Clostridium TaxID=2614128 RepID=UPI0005FBB3AA|nr:MULTISPECIES: hypothetical protein [unclassified Clostridium]